MSRSTGGRVAPNGNLHGGADIVVELQLLGPVEFSERGHAREVGPPQRRAVLAALAVDTAMPVATDVLITRVWGTEPPDGARRALHAHIARLRRLCEGLGEGDDLRFRLLRRSGGYVLEAGPAQVDILRFRHLVGRAREAGRPDEDRASLLREALGLWHGEPLAGVGGQWAARVREAWRRRHVDAAVGWARLTLRAGDPVAVIGPLGDLLGAYPLVEPLSEALMRALYAAGRGAEALSCYAALRRRLTEELGSDPSPGLQDVHQGILRDRLSPAPAWPTTAVTVDDTGITPAFTPTPSEPRTPPPPPPGTPARPGELPAQLPLGVRGFTGRVLELAQLDGLVGAAAGPPRGAVICAVSGTAGVGKTALAVHWARRAQDTFPDGQLYVNLRGFAPGGTAMGPADAVRGFLDAFGVPPSRIPVGLDAQAALYRSLLTGRRVLVVLDNARDAEQIRPLLPGSPGCMALVTSRNLLTGLAAAEGAHLLSLGLLTPEQARDLLSRRLGADRTEAEPDAVREIVDRCAGLPLALAVLAARAAADPGLPLARLAAELGLADSRLDALDGGEPASQIRAVFSWSYHALRPETARMFRLLGLHPGPDTGLPSAAALAGARPAEIRPLLTELVRGHLLTESAARRYSFHDLLRAYAAELVVTHDSEAVRHGATLRMLDHYAHTAHRADVLLTPHPRPVTLPSPQPGSAPVELMDHQQSQEWFDGELPVLVAALHRAAADGFDTHTHRLASALTTYLDRHGHWRVLTAVQTAALDAARRQGDTAGQADAHRGLGLAHDRLKRNDEARTHYLLALQLFGALGLHSGQARTFQHLARMSAAQGLHQEALAHAHDSLTHYRAADDRAGQSAALNHIGWLHAQLGHQEKALVHCRQALALAEETGDLNGQAHTWDSLGYIHHHLAQYAQAVDCYQRAVALFHRTGEFHGEAASLVCLGDIHHACSAPRAAHHAWTRALAIADRLGLTATDPLRTGLLPRLRLPHVRATGGRSGGAGSPHRPGSALV
ncbi:BTAD domain-containing putative transcriptional regulator [Streptomyces sp. NPDC002667]|uniref:AfsR/SARP family transcriptional regulator n=1 Tax=Streptomyces sp. NPDC002667 TaxID=3364657 RepID=UPI0036BE8505